MITIYIKPMKRKIVFALIFVQAMFCNSASAYDAYVYLSGNYVPVNVSNEIHAMIFDDEYTYFITEQNDTAMISNTAFTFITFHKVDVPVGISQVKASDVMISSENDGIRIKSNGIPASVKIIDAAGSVIADITPKSNDLFFSIVGLPAGIYVVKVSDGAKTTVKKITKNK